mgnify:CR=1 FL=1
MRVRGRRRGRRHGDLAAALKKLKARQGCHLFSRLDKIIIEGADACDAADVHVAFLDEEVASFARLDAIVSCVRLEAKCDVDMGLVRDTTPAPGFNHHTKSLRRRKKEAFAAAEAAPAATGKLVTARAIVLSG